jgi:hypothetical protein
MKVVAFDADVLGRRRTGDETYALNLLRELGEIAEPAGVRIVAIPRYPQLVPGGIEALELQTRVQELRMGWSLPRALSRLGADLSHSQHAVPLRPPCPCVVTVHDLSFARQPELMSLKDRVVFRRIVPRAVRRAARVLTVSERTKGTSPISTGSLLTRSSSHRTASTRSSDRPRRAKRDQITSCQ